MHRAKENNPTLTYEEMIVKDNVIYVEKPCLNCGKKRLKKTTKFLHYPNTFCNKKCSNNFHFDKRIIGNQRSKAEDILSEIILRNHPGMILENNKRDLFPNESLEIDIYLPKLSLAIEVNGPVHYLPIYGEDKLKDVRKRDRRKKKLLKDSNNHLISIDISLLTGNENRIKRFMEDYYLRKINPKIQNLI
jgi:hypothetical protein